jgi:outer membrane receptor protein involved in Fe transport
MARPQGQSSIAGLQSIEGQVTDASGNAVQHARVTVGGVGEAVTFPVGSDGHFTVRAKAGKVELHIEAEGFQPAVLLVQPGTGEAVPTIVHVQLSPAGRQETVEVTAYGTPLAEDSTAASTLLVTQKELQQTAGQPLDDKLRQVPGYELFRRTSSLVANPTSQGVSLRGLGSTAASRTLVLADEDPLNDPYGGWIHWDEIPELALQGVTIVRGGASDLYGSSAIGGVIDLDAVKPRVNTAAVNLSYGSLNTLDEAALGTAHSGRWSGLATGGVLETDGYTLVAPSVRGVVDVPSNVHAENGRVEVDRGFLTSGNVFFRTNLLNEARSNGTPLTSNGTRLWRVESGGDWADGSGGSLLVRLHGLSDHYRQTFSSVAAGRGSEALTRFVETPATELGGTVRWTQAIKADLLVLGGADVRDVRAEDNEIGYSVAGPTRGLPSSMKDIAARQRQTGLYGEVLWTPAKWTLSAGGRVDFFRNLDAHEFGPVNAPEPTISQDVFDPRVGVLRRLTTNFAVTATAFRAFRAPSENELYRTGQVGQTTTLPNADLLSERATGWETGVVISPHGYVPGMRTSYFWTEVDRPITALTIATTPTAITAMRENLGQIRSRGVSIDFDAHPLRWLTATGGYQFADATVTQNSGNPALVGLWIPQVAHNMATAQLQAEHAKLGLFRLEGRLSGHQFDDDANTFRLSGYFELNGYLSHSFSHGVEVYASGENLLNRTIQAGRTPVLTLATPQVGTIGLRWHLGE